MGSPFTLGMIVGCVFGATVMGVAAWLFDRLRYDKEYGHMMAAVRFEAARAARETIARLIPTKDRRATVQLKLPREDRPTEVWDPREPK